MPKKKKTKKTAEAAPAPAPNGPAVTVGEGVHILPRKPRPEAQEPQGFQPGPGFARKRQGAQTLAIRPEMAGDRSSLFPHGGAAFARWCKDQGIGPRSRRTEDEWGDLLAEFAAQPIHGHRREKHGGSHKVKRAHLR